MLGYVHKTNTVLKLIWSLLLVYDAIMEGLYMEPDFMVVVYQYHFVYSLWFF